jgi:hypothetical protein
VAFFPDLSFLGATLRAGLAPLAFSVAFGTSAAGARAFSSASAVEIMVFLLDWRGFRITWITLIGRESKQILKEIEAWRMGGDGATLARSWHQMASHGRTRHKTGT